MATADHAENSGREPPYPGILSLRSQTDLRKAPLTRAFSHRRHTLRFSPNAWLGREDSNLRMAESKSAALPLGDAPPAAGWTRPERADHSAGIFAPQAFGPVFRSLAPLSAAQRPPRASAPAEILLAHPLQAPTRAAIRPALSRVWRSSPCRSVAQPGSAPRSGRGGRRFESSHSDHLIQHSAARTHYLGAPLCVAADGSCTHRNEFAPASGLEACWRCS
jgi:hypothetical protein